ncbi:hypothetical protein C5Y93_28970 [Blastopirellula marina]|uniref:Uncharacterized protein n=1 Tax=Blastopirellula marina TaxID=124 RepID=A0A2S8GD43_9BACT|nr:hypothetical protein C5Y93_28970 [Blastopirellula marina]
MLAQKKMNRQFSLQYPILGVSIFAKVLCVMRQDLLVGMYCLGIGCFLMGIVTIESYSVCV